MNSTASGREAERRAFSAHVQVKDSSNTSCSFCWFVMSIYPTLKGMTPQDRSTFTEHLKSAHGLREEIPQ